MANIDIRVEIGMLRNRKVRALIRSLGHDLNHPICSLLNIWFYCAERAPKGILHETSPPGVEDIAEWDGEPGKLFEELTSRNFIKRIACAEHAGSNALCIEVHDWEEHQGYIFNSDKRSLLGKHAADARWQKRMGVTKPKKKQPDMPSASGGHAKRIRNECRADAPIPTPAPAPIAGQGIGDLSSLSGAVDAPDATQPVMSEEEREQGRKTLSEALEKIGAGKTESTIPEKPAEKGNGKTSWPLTREEETEHEQKLIELVDEGCNDEQAGIALALYLRHKEGIIDVYVRGDEMRKAGMTGKLAVRVYEVLRG